MGEEREGVGISRGVWVVDGTYLASGGKNSSRRSLADARPSVRRSGDHVSGRTCSIGRALTARSSVCQCRQADLTDCRPAYVGDLILKPVRRVDGCSSSLPGLQGRAGVCGPRCQRFDISCQRQDC